MFQAAVSLELPEPHQLMNAWNCLTAPRRIYKGDEEYKRYTLYELIAGQPKLIGSLYAIDRRDAWHCFSNRGLIDPAKDYEIL